MKIACVTNVPLDASLGSGKTVIEWSSGFRRVGHEVVVFAPDDFFRPFIGGYLKRLKMRWDANSLEQHLRKKGYDLIEFYGGEFGWLTTRLASHSTRPLLVAHTNGLELLASESQQFFATSNWKQIIKWPVQKLVEECNRSAFVNADRFVAICNLDAKYIISHGIQPAEHTVVVEPGIDTEYLNTPFKTKREQLVVYFGTWSERKAPDRIVRVMTHVLEHEPACYFEIIGASYDRQEILDAFPAELRDRVKVHPKLSIAEIITVLQRAKVMFFPSHYEGFGMAISEAMACGCAVVVTPTGFGADLQDGIDAFVRDFSDENGMRKNIRHLLRDDSVRIRIAKAGWQRVQKMTWENQSRQLVQIYSQWLDAWHWHLSHRLSGV
jgi:glycosyltransferase involved in cell wall biosynthesis